MKLKVSPRWPTTKAKCHPNDVTAVTPIYLKPVTNSTEQQVANLTINREYLVPNTHQLSVSCCADDSIMNTHSSLTRSRPSFFRRILRRFKPGKGLKDEAPVPEAETAKPGHQRPASSSRTVTTSLSSSSSTHSNNNDESDDTDDNDVVDQKLYWGPIPSIPNWRVRQLVLRLVGSTICDSCWVHTAMQGSFNQVFIIMFGNEAKVCLKIPATGWTKRWTSEEAAELRREALTLKYVHQQLGGSFPAPELLAYDTTMNNEIDAPYMLMSYLPGTSGLQSWYTSEWDNDLNKDYYRYCHRKKILKSLAHHMAKLRAITFPAIGVLEFDNDACENPRVVAEMRSCIDWDNAQDPERPFQKAWTKIDMQTETQKFFRIMVEHSALEDTTNDRARQALLKPVVSGLPPSWDAPPQPMPTSPLWRRPEMFSLSHDDLDLQNIVCDDDGNVTGILDWERVTVRPHFMGWCTIPMWIREDMSHGKPWPFNSQRRFESPVQMAEFRRFYSNVLAEAIGSHKDITMDESDALPDNVSWMSHLGHSLYDGLRAYDARQLRHFCDIAATMIFPNTPLDPLYKELGKRGRSCDDFELPESEDNVDDLVIWMMKRCEHIMQYGSPEEWTWTEFPDDDEAVESNQDDGDEDEESFVDLSRYLPLATCGQNKKNEAKPLRVESPPISGEPSSHSLPASSRPSSRGSDDGLEHSDTASSQSSLISESMNDIQMQSDFGHFVPPLVRSDGYPDLVAAAQSRCVANKHLRPLLDWSLPPDSTYQAQ